MERDSTQWFKPGLHTLQPVQRHLVDAQMHRLQWNENPFDFPADLKEEVLQRLSVVEWARYPLGLRPWALIDRLAQHYGVASDQVVVSNGSSDLIRALLAGALGPGDTIVMPAPTFLLYRQNARLQQAQIVEVPLTPDDDWALPVDALIEAAHAHQARLMVLCAPNNPTGTIYPVEEVRRIAEAAPGLLIVDEAYAEFCDQDLTPLLALGNVVLVRTFSKLFAMAGIRVGYALAAPAVAAQLQKAITGFPVSVFSEITAEVALDHADRFYAQRDLIVSERARMTAELRTLPGLRVFSSGTNFLLVEIPGAKHDLVHHLRSQHAVLISDMAGYPGLDQCVRISIGAPAQNDLVLEGFRGHFRADSEA